MCDDDVVLSRRSSVPVISTATSEAEMPLIPPPPVPPDPIPPKPLDSYIPNEEPSNITKPFEPTFFRPKAISYSNISPSSIPNPSPSVSITKHLEPGYSNYGGYLYTIPGYSAFQPVSYSGFMPPHQPLPTSEPSNPDFVPFPSIPKESTEDKNTEVNVTESQSLKDNNTPKPQTDFEEQFTPEIIPATTMPDSIQNINESKMSITSLAQGSGATVTIPSQICNNDVKKKLPERFSLKTSIPISKIDMKSVGNSSETILTNAVTKKTFTFNPAFITKTDSGPKIEIQSNIIIKGATKDNETSDTKHTPTSTCSTEIKKETVNKMDNQFRKPEPKNDVINDINDSPPNFTPPSTTTVNFTPPNTNTKSVISPMNTETNKLNLPPKPPEGNINEQKNQILLIQNKNQNPKMLLTIQQQNPQVLLQRTNFESKNAQVPSRLPSQNKNCKEETSENGSSSKVVALKRLHHENCDENDFENLITENQIYGNKIVVKEKSQRTLQEQELNNKKVEKPVQETKNVVLQPNFVYLSNVQFPANLMMIKSNAKANQPSDLNKVNKAASNENKVTNEASTMTNSNDLNNTKNNISPTTPVSKEIHVLKSSNNVLQTLSYKNNKPDIVIQSNQKVMMNPQIVYQVPMIVDGDKKLNQPFINRENQKFIGQNKKEHTKLDNKSKDKLYIARPYQVDPTLQPKIVIANIRQTINKMEEPKKYYRLDEVSSIDIYEKRKRLRRLKYLSTRDTKEVQKVDNMKKVPEKIDLQKNLITPDKINEEICKEFTNNKEKIEEGSSESESDYDDDYLEKYDAIIKEYAPKIVEINKQKTDFLSQFGLGTHEAFIDKELNRQERIIRRDAVASAYISIGRIDRLSNYDNTFDAQLKTQNKEIQREERDEVQPNTLDVQPKIQKKDPSKEEKDRRREKMDELILQDQQFFLSQLRLTQVTEQYKEGYENIWKEIVSERKRRNSNETESTCKLPKVNNTNLELDSNGQLQILIEIKKSVNANNNLIKKKIDSSDGENVNEGDSIHTLAEKNISELDRLSKMAGISVKLITGQDARKIDLNPGVDSEKIQKPVIKLPPINIPNIAKIISLKSQDTDASQVVTSQATSMDEPVNSAAGVDILNKPGKVKDVAYQDEKTFPWSNIQAMIKNYKDFEAARKKEINELHRRNTSLRVEGAYITRNASRDSDRTKAHLAERRLLSLEEAAVKRSLYKLTTAIEAIRHSW